MTRKRIISIEEIREGATYEIGGVKFKGWPYGDEECYGLLAVSDREDMLPPLTVDYMLTAGIAVTEISPPPMPEHVEPAYVPHNVYVDASGETKGEWVYLPFRGDYQWLPCHAGAWLTRDELPARLRLIRSSTPVEDQS